MTTNEGFVTFNVLCHDKEVLNDIYSKLRDVQTGGKYLVEGDEDANKVLILTKKEATPEE